MLLNNRMASIPCANRHSAAYTKDIPTALRHDVEFSNDYFRSSSPTAALQYFNMRVTQRLHRYRSLKRQWQEVATSIHYPCQSLVRLPTGNFSETNSPIHDAPRAKFQPKQRKITESKSFTINDVLNPNASNGKDEAEKIPIELDPLHTRIQQDLIKLRKFIRNKQGKSTDGSSTKTSSDRKYSDEMTTITSAFEEQENRQIHNGISHYHQQQQRQVSSSPKRLKPLDHVKIAGAQMRRPTLVKSESMNSPTNCPSNSSSTCSQYSKVPLKVKIPKSNETPTGQNNFSSLTPIFRAASSKKKLAQATKLISTTSSSQRSPSRRPSLLIPSPPVLSEKVPSFTKQEIILPPISRVGEDADATPFDYTYAASSSSTVPPSMIINRNNSLLPILLHSTCCIGLQPGKSSSLMTSECESQLDEETLVNENDNYYHLLSYKQLINRLPTPIISNELQYGKDDYEVLFDQLNHVRETMPNSSTYDDYVRVNI